MGVRCINPDYIGVGKLCKGREVIMTFAPFVQPWFLGSCVRAAVDEGLLLGFLHVTEAYGEECGGCPAASKKEVGQERRSAQSGRSGKRFARRARHPHRNERGWQSFGIEGV